MTTDVTGTGASLGPAQSVVRVAVVTGGASGIGFAAAQALGRSGLRILLADRSAAAGEAAALALRSEGIDAASHRTDVAVPADIAAMTEAAMTRWGRLDVMVANAGVADQAPFLEASLEHWNKVLSVNLTGVFLCGQSAARLMASGGGGRIINVASVSGMLAGINRTAYGTSKAGVMQLTRQMALELGPLGITVNAVAPGPTDTPMAHGHIPPAIAAAYIERIPVGRFGLASEVGAAIAWLASPEAAYVNGQVLAIDGGYLIAGVRPVTERQSLSDIAGG